MSDIALYNKNTDTFILDVDINKINKLYEIDDYHRDIKNLEYNLNKFFIDFPTFKKCDKTQQTLNNFINRIGTVKNKLNARQKELDVINLLKKQAFDEKKQKYMQSYEPYIKYIKRKSNLEKTKSTYEAENPNVYSNVENENGYFDYNRLPKKLRVINSKIEENMCTFHDTCEHKYMTDMYQSGYERYKECLVCGTSIFISERHP